MQTDEHTFREQLVDKFVLRTDVNLLAPEFYI